MQSITLKSHIGSDGLLKEFGRVDGLQVED
jgi:hypothetical protein